MKAWPSPGVPRGLGRTTPSPPSTVKGGLEMKQRSWLAFLASIAVGAVCVSALPATATADAAACDGTKENPCPLQKWMRANMGAPSAAGDNAALATAYDKVIAMLPDPSWATKPDGTGWVDISKAGA